MTEKSESRKRSNSVALLIEKTKTRSQGARERERTATTAAAVFLLFSFRLTPFFSPPSQTRHPLFPRPRQREDRRRHGSPRWWRRRARLPPQERFQALEGHRDLGLEKDVAEARGVVGWESRGVAQARPEARRGGQGVGGASRGEGTQGELQGRGRRDRRRVERRERRGEERRGEREIVFSFSFLSFPLAFL